MAQAVHYWPSMKTTTTNLLAKLARFHNDANAATAVEYAVMLALIVGVAIVAITSVGSEAEGFWDNNANELDSALN